MSIAKGKEKPIAAWEALVVRARGLSLHRLVGATRCIREGEVLLAESA
jgi:hypothetical protein